MTPTRPDLRQLESCPPSDGHDVFFPLDASEHHIVQGNTHKKFFSSGRIAQAPRLNTVPVDIDEASRCLNTNANVSPRVYRPFISRNVKPNADYKAHPGSIPSRNPLDRLYISSPDGLEASMSNRVSQRELPTPPGPPGMGWERFTFAEPALPGALTRSRGRF
jgi:hypothetical protein